MKRMSLSLTRGNPKRTKETEITIVTINYEELQGDPATKCDAETQIDFLNDDAKTMIQVFVCNRHISVISCDTETQAYSLLIENMKKRNEKSTDGAGLNTLQSPLVSQKVKKQATPNQKIECNSGFHGYSSIKNSQQLLDLADVIPDTFKLLLKILSRDDSTDHGRTKISYDNRLLIFLIKMKCGITFSVLSALFGVHRSTISLAFYSTLVYLTAACQNFVMWPLREVIDATMPEIFKDSYSNCRAIIDCTEFVVEQPPTIEQRVQFYSYYKKGFRLIVFVVCTPSGFISFVSKCHGGRTTESQITSTCGFLDLLEPGDLVLADKGFPQIKTKLDKSGLGILVVKPPFLYNNSFTEEQVNETYKIAKVRIHIERIMQRIRTYKIVDKFTTEMLPYCYNIIFMCCVLVNLQPPIIKESM